MLSAGVTPLSNQVYYFIQTYPPPSPPPEDNAWPEASIVEVWSDSQPEPPSPFHQPITLEELHALGYLSPTEAKNEAKRQGNIDDQVDWDYYWGSYIATELRLGVKRVYCGSYTGRRYVPGPLGLQCKTYRNRNLMHAFGPYNT